MNNTSLTEHTLFDGAKMYASAADAVNDKMPNSLHVLSHLMCTRIELALKAFLFHVGFTEKRLRKIGHDLQELFNTVEKEGFTYTGSRNFVLAVSGEVYKQRLFVYPENCNMNIILPFRLRQMTDELLNEVFHSIYKDDIEEKQINLKGLSIESEYLEDVDASNWYKPIT